MLTVKELTNKLPDVDIGELKDGVKYVFRLHEKYVAPERLGNIRRMLAEFGLNALVVTGDVDMFEIID